MPTLSLGFSPCPNDTFIFDALVNKKINLHGIDLKLVIADVAASNGVIHAIDTVVMPK